MSGGFFSYYQYHIDHVANDIEQLLVDNYSTEKNEWGDPKGRNYSEETMDQFRVALMLLRAAYVYAHRIDWLVSGDDSEESFHSRLADDITKLEEAR